MRVETAMPIALESGARFVHGAPPPPCGGSSSAGRGSDSRAEAVLDEEPEEGDGEVQSSLRGPFDTMDALQDALPRRREVSKFYNSKSRSLENAGDAALSPQSSKDLANPENPSPKKRKGPLPFGISQNETQSKELSPVGDDTNSPTHCRKPLYPTGTSSPPCKSRSGVTPQTQLISAQMRSSAVGQDVAESTDAVSPREKRRKN